MITQERQFTPVRRRLRVAPVVVRRHEPPPADFEAMVEERVAEDQYVRWLGSQGRWSEIASPLSALVGRVEVVSVPISAELRGGFTPSTPSVLCRSDRRLAIVRGVNYRQSADQRTLFAAGEARCITRNWWCEFDRDWNLTAARVMVDPYPERPGAVQGYEDCRLFHAAGRYYASANFAERPQLIGDNTMGLLCEMALLQLSDAGDIERVSAVRGPWSPYNQKNWKPAPTDAEPLRWIYASDPLTLVSPHMARDCHATKWYSVSAWRGSSQAVRAGSHWLWVDHRPVVHFDGDRHLYLHRFVLADEALTHIEAVSAPFVFHGYQVEFCAGLALDGDRAVLSYSTKDAAPFITICSLEAVLRSLGRVA